jgi:hypothetical protein
MKLKFVLMLSLSILVTSFAHASNEDVIANSIVQSASAFMQVKHNGACEKLAPESVRWFCTGAIPPIEKLQLMKSGCRVMVKILCPGEEMQIWGSTASVYALDASGARNDIEPIDLGLTFDDMQIVPLKK